jgi:hypothetical protein
MRPVGRTTARIVIRLLAATLWFLCDFVTFAAPVAAPGHAFTHSSSPFSASDAQDPPHISSSPNAATRFAPAQFNLASAAWTKQQPKTAANNAATSSSHAADPTALTLGAWGASLLASLAPRAYQKYMFPWRSEPLETSFSPDEQRAGMAPDERALLEENALWWQELRERTAAGVGADVNANGAGEEGEGCRSSSDMLAEF